MSEARKSMSLHFGHTEKGFPVITFRDRYDVACRIENSALAFESAVWFGVDEPDPRICIPYRKEMLPGLRGGRPYPIPDNVRITTRMLITREQMAALLPILTYFVQTGELPSAISDPGSSPLAPPE
jgi:hypothetical protein